MSHRTSNGGKMPLTVIGLGPMGQAMTRAFLREGHQVTVWNRTAARAADVVAAGARHADSLSDAIAASDVLVLSLTDYQAMYDILDGASDALRGRTIVNLSSDSPGHTSAAAVWAAEHGATLIVGGVMVPAPEVGTESAVVYYSGPSREFETLRNALSAVGRLRYLGEDPALAQLMYQAHLDVFLTSLSALLHATALLGSAGLPASEVMPDLIETLRTTPDLGDAAAAAEEIDSGVHPGRLSTALMMGATADHVVLASGQAGIDMGLPRAVQAHYRRVIEDGHGQDNWTRIIDAIRQPSRHEES